jgi:hypothetical protein
MEGAHNMRLSFLCASAALATGLALSACSGGAGSSSAVPSSGAQAVVSRSDGHSLVTRLMPGVKPLISGCNYSVYAFCFYVTPENDGPYVETSAGSGYELYNHAWIVRNKNKTGKIDKKFHTYFSPDPGNPTYQYINDEDRNPKKVGPVKFTDYYCIGFTASACSGSTYTFKLGIAIQPAT